MEEKKAELQQLSSRIRDNIIEAVTSDRDEKILDDLKHRLIVSLIFVVPLIGVTLLEDDTIWGKALEAALLIPIVRNDRCGIHASVHDGGSVPDDDGALQMERGLCEM